MCCLIFPNERIINFKFVRRINFYYIIPNSQFTIHNSPLTTSTPLAERLRPENLDQLIGQQHLTGKGSILRTALENHKIPSMILWGPPGVGKTTIANIIAHTLKCSVLHFKRHFIRCKRSA